MAPFSTIWTRIEAQAGQKFRQKGGNEFTYRIEYGQLIPDRTNQRIPKSEFEKALNLVPIETTTALQSLRGPSYIYAILMDQRIRMNDW